jgi:hypothetical protein
MTQQEARDKFKVQMRTRYTDEHIRRAIDYSLDCGDPDWALANATAAQAMIAYNEMVSRRVSDARKSWGLE